MNTKQAFEKLINSDLWKSSGLNDSTVRAWRKRMQDNKSPSVAVMEKALYQAGAKKIPEKWIFKKKAGKNTPYPTQDEG